MLVDTQDPAPARRARGTTSKNVSGNSTDRRRRKAWLVETFRADVDLDGEPACRCYRCGVLLTVDTVSPDRIKPGCLGGSYRRENLRPACLPCNMSTGGALGAARRAAR